ncbi:MAG: bifunctional phosphoribosylaminoimidazolecarboxamide formyltransferase/IMP cyclohydrolase [Planctomycetota bacterium]
MTVQVKRALISVSDKSGIENFARALSEAGVELLSTGGTHARIAKAGIPVREVAEHTGFPEMMDGRVKTLHPKIHGGLLALRDNDAHVSAMKEHDIGAIDLAVVNLYPFEETIAKGASRAEAIEQIDIGGPSMVRSAAKNHRSVGIVTDPKDYGRVLEDMQENDGALSENLRRELARKAYGLTARYDAAISRWLFEQEDSETTFPESFSLAGVKTLELRYGENPHQKAAFYTHDGAEPSLATAEVLNGKALSYNNLVDLDAALALAKEFAEPFVCVCKHNNPCGAAVSETIADALEQAWAGDPLSAFGSVLAFTRPVDLASATFLVDGGRFVEAIVAPSFDDDAFELLTKKPKWGKNVRLLALGDFAPNSRLESDVELKKVTGGFLVQERDLAAETAEECTAKTKAAPTSRELEDLLFAARVMKHVKSNAIVIAKAGRVLGVGAGQMSRVDAVRLAATKGGDEVAKRDPEGGSVLASDAFFPFPDGVENAIEAGVSAILQPGGSIRDDEVVATCDRLGASMVFTGRRHFRH